MAGTNSNYSGATNANGGALTVSGNLNTVGEIMVGDTANSFGLLTVTGSLTAGKTVSPSLDVGGSVASGAGALHVSSGAVISTASELHLGAAGYGAMTMNSGSVAVGNWFCVGEGNGYGALNASGGTLAVTTTTNFGNLVLCCVGSNATGVANFSGNAVVNLVGDLYLVQNDTNYNTAVANISGNAVVTAAGGVQFGNALSGTTANDIGTLNLLGGTLAAKSVTVGTSVGAWTLNFNGGTLKASPSAAATFMTGLTAAYVQTSGGTIDNSGQSITIGQSLLSPSGSGVTASGLTLGGANSGYIDTPVVVVNNTGTGGSGATAVATVSGGQVTGVTITNPGSGYASAPTFTLVGGGGSATVGGSAALAPNVAGGLTFVGSGVTTLSGSNTYSGTTTLSAGTLALGGVSALAGTGNLTFAGGTLQFTAANTALASTPIKNSAAPVNFNTNGQSVVVATTIDSSNTAGMTVGGGGVLAVSNTLGYSGPTVITAGTLKLSASMTYGLPVVTGGTLARWYDAQIPGSLWAPGGLPAANGGAVATWSDQSVNSSNATQTTAANQPLYTISGINGHPALVFGGSPQDMLFNTTGLNYSTNPTTMFVVGQMTAGNTVGNWQWMASYGTATNGQNRALGMKNGAAPFYPDISAYGIDGTSGTAVPLATPIIMGGAWGGTGSTLAGTFITSSGTQTATANGTLGGANAGSGFIGEQTNGLNEYWNGTIGEVIIYNGGLSATDQQKVENYLNAEWLGAAGVTPTGGTLAGNLPSGSPVQIATSGAALDLNGGTQQVASLADYPAVGASSGIVQNSNLLFPAILTLSATGGSTTYSGSILGGGVNGAISLVMSGSGTQVLAGINTYTGGTTISSGLLQLGTSAANALGSGGLTANGGTLDLNGNNLTSGGNNALPSLSGRAGTITDNNTSGGSAATVLTVNQNGNTTFGGSILIGNYAPGISLQKYGSGSLTLSGTSTTGGAQVWNNGTLAITGSLTSTSGASLHNTATLLVNGGFTSLSDLTVNGGAQLAGTGTINLAGGQGLYVSSSTPFAFGGTLTGVQGVEVDSPSRVTLTGSSNFTGPTLIDAGGQLAAGAANTLSASSDLTVSGTLERHRLCADRQVTHHGGRRVESLRQQPFDEHQCRRLQQRHAQRLRLCPRHDRGAHRLRLARNGDTFGAFTVNGSASTGYQLEYLGHALEIAPLSLGNNSKLWVGAHGAPRLAGHEHDQRLLRPRHAGQRAGGDRPLVQQRRQRRHDQRLGHRRRPGPDDHHQRFHQRIDFLRHQRRAEHGQHRRHQWHDHHCQPGRGFRRDGRGKQQRTRPDYGRRYGAGAARGPGQHGDRPGRATCRRQSFAQ